MMGWTDRHQRAFVRSLSKHAVVYSEMLSPEAILLGERARHLDLDPIEAPVAFQLGGHQPEALALAARAVEQAGYQEVNFNLGCPSTLGATRRFGCHLMKEPELVAECLEAMVQSVSIPVTVKLRLGYDDHDSYAELLTLVKRLAEAGPRVFIVHARKAWLHGLSTRANRAIPPLRYDYVYRLKADLGAAFEVIVNGAITDWTEARNHLLHVDGVMVGRRAYRDPYCLADVDAHFYHTAQPPAGRSQVLHAYLPYVERELQRGTRLRHLVRHLIGLWQGPGARRWRTQVARAEADRRAGRERYLELIELMTQLEAERVARGFNAPAGAESIA